MLARLGFEFVQKVGAVGESPAAPALGITEPLRDQQGDVDHQRQENGARQCGAYGTPTNSHGAQVTKRLSEHRKGSSRGRSEVVRPGPDNKAIAEENRKQSEEWQTQS